MENQQCRLVHTGNTNSTRTDTGTEKSLRNQYIARTYSVKTGSPRHPATALNELIILCNQGAPRCKLLVHVRYGNQWINVTGWVGIVWSMED